MNQAGSTLRGLGRLTEAIKPMTEGAADAADMEHWTDTARRLSNLSGLHLALGNLPDAVGTARRAVEFADRSSDDVQRFKRRANLADALHQSREFAEATQLFAEAEQIKKKAKSTEQLLDSIQGYRYCDLLLGRGEVAEVLRRASETIRKGEGPYALLEIGLDHLSLGRAHPPDSYEAAHHLDQAVDFLRRAGQLQYLPLALLARGTLQDLDEVFRIATRSGMRLHLTDYHLASARLALRDGDRPKALDHFTKADTLVQETGYHRRDPELAHPPRRPDDHARPHKITPFLSATYPPLFQTPSPPHAISESEANHLCPIPQKPSIHETSQTCPPHPLR